MDYGPIGSIIAVVCALLLVVSLAIPKQPDVPLRSVLKPDPGLRGEAAQILDGHWTHRSDELFVAGTSHRKIECNKFIAMIDQADDGAIADPYGLRLERDRNNEHDSNAIRVIGFCGDFGFHVGFVDAEHAKTFAPQWMDKGYPMAADLVGVDVDDEGYVDINYQILIADNGAIDRE